MLQKTRGIVLHRIKYSDSSVIVYIYTEKSGRQAFLVRGARRKKSHIKINLFQPLYALDLEIYFNPKRELQSIKEYNIIIPFVSIPYSIQKSTIVLFLGEMLYRFLLEEEANNPLFEYLLNSIHYLDNTEKSVSNFHLLFLIQLTKYLGFNPNDNFSEQTPVLDLKNGVFVQTIPNHTNYLNLKESKLFYNLQSTSFEKANLLKLSSASRTNLLARIIDFYKLHQSFLGEIKSFQIMKEVFHQE